MTGEVRISPQQVYEEVLGMKDSLGKIESFMERHVALQEQTNVGVEARLENHGTRLGNHDSDLTGLRTDLTLAQTDIRLLKEVNVSREKEKVPVMTRVRDWVSLAVGIGGLITVLLFLDKLSAVYQQYGP